MEQLSKGPAAKQLLDESAVEQLSDGSAKKQQSGEPAENGCQEDLQRAAVGAGTRREQL
jgi:hypothetical protein